jgi:hypothetical protein
VASTEVITSFAKVKATRTSKHFNSMPMEIWLAHCQLPWPVDGLYQCLSQKVKDQGHSDNSNAKMSSQHDDKDCETW